MAEHSEETHEIAARVLGHESKAALDESNRKFAESDGVNAEYGHGIGVTLGDPTKNNTLRRGISRWFKGEPNVVDGHWLCPKDDCDCDGEMVDTGWTWPMVLPGHHHECTKCDLVAAITGHQYPEVSSDG